MKPAKPKRTPESHLAMVMASLQHLITSMEVAERNLVSRSFVETIARDALYNAREALSYLEQERRALDSNQAARNNESIG